MRLTTSFLILLLFFFSSLLAGCGPEQASPEVAAQPPVTLPTSPAPKPGITTIPPATQVDEPASHLQSLATEKVEAALHPPCMWCT